jgi:hypothetical protein
MEWLRNTLFDDQRKSSGMITMRPAPEQSGPSTMLELDPLLSSPPPPLQEPPLPSVAPNSLPLPPLSDPEESSPPPSSVYPSLTQAEVVAMIPEKPSHVIEMRPISASSLAVEQRETTDTEKAFMILGGRVNNLYNNVLVMVGLSGVFSLLCVVVAVLKFQMVH